MSQRIYPTAERVAEALLLAALHTGEAETLGSSRGLKIDDHLAPRCRFVAFAALLALHLHASPLRLARMVNIRRNCLARLERVRCEGWWRQDLVIWLVAALAAEGPKPALLPWAPDRAAAVCRRLVEGPAA